jgi:hypothetical protein
MLFIQKQMKNLKNKKAALFRWISVHASIQFERAFSGILSFNKKKIDLIVMGSHGTSGIEEMVIGSNTEKIVRLRNPSSRDQKTIQTFNNFVLPLIFRRNKKPFQKWSNFPKCLMPICFSNDLHAQ